MEQALYLVLGAALTWAFYFVQRRVERRPSVEAIDRHEKLLALKQGLERAEVSLGDLRRFEARLIGQAETAARIADRYFSQAEDVARQVAVDEISDAQMQQRAGEAFEAADVRLRTLVSHLRTQLDGEALATFEMAHATWLELRERYAAFIAASYAGGGIRPLIHAVTLEGITLGWFAELETQLGDGGDEDDADDI
ncbi:lysozyme inhibitor LprI family protein [Lysobacter sp. A3-1-A15]